MTDLRSFRDPLRILPIYTAESIRAHHEAYLAMVSLFMMMMTVAVTINTLMMMMMMMMFRALDALRPIIFCPTPLFGSLSLPSNRGVSELDHGEDHDHDDDHDHGDGNDEDESRLELRDE